MNAKALGFGLLAVGVAAWSGYELGMKRAIPIPAATPAATTATSAASAGGGPGAVAPATERKILYWHDPMVPGQRFDKPGKSPFMDMQLAPVYADGGGDAAQVSVSPRIQQNLGMRTAEVKMLAMAPRMEAVGSIAFNERDQAVVQARATGYIERLYVRATLDRVARGQPLADLYVPEWVAAQEEFLSVRRMQGTDLAVLVDGARQRMRQAGMNEEQIRLVESTGRLHPRIALNAPIAGVMVELLARDGMTVMPGATLFRINGLSSVWANAEVPESQAGLLTPGAAVEARSPGVPGAIFKGRVQAILPEVSAATRTLRARIELANPGGKLAPGMFVNVSAAPKAQQVLAVPTEAIIQTGRRTVVMLTDGAGKFRPAEVEIGMEADGQTQIKRGLEPGQTVVVSGQFLIDSEASLRATAGRMEDTPRPGSTVVEHEGQGRVEALGKDGVTLSHGPIPSIKWGAMTMDFAAPAAGLPQGLKAGQQVKFRFTVNKDGAPLLTGIEPINPGAAEKKK